MAHESTRVIEISADHPAFTGHFPGKPIVPGVVLLDRVLAAVTEDPALAGRDAQIRAAKFLAPVGPGARLELRLAFDARGGLNFEFSQAGGIVASGSLSFSPRP